MIDKKVDEAWYLQRYPDVLNSDLSATEHYEKIGRAAGRFPCQPTVADYFIVYPRKLRYSSLNFFKKIKKQKKVNTEWYLRNYPDVVSSGMSAQEHYHFFGRSEGRLPYPPGPVFRSYRNLVICAKVLQFLAKEKGYNGALHQLFRCYRHEGFTALKHFVMQTHMLIERSKQTHYANWITSNELGKDDFLQAQTELANMELQPLISVIMPTYNSNLDWLTDAIESIRAQPYSNWELCIADDASPHSNIKLFLAQWAARDSRIKFVARPKNGHISEASNSAIDIAKGDWLALFDHDDLLHPFAFYWVIKAINKYPNAQLIYSDEDKIDEYGRRHEPYFKPDWNYDLFLSQNCFSHLGLITRHLANRIGGFRKGFEGSQDHDLILRATEIIPQSNIVHIPKVLYHWRVHAESTAKSSSSKPYAALAGERAIGEHLQRIGRAAQVSFEGYGYRVKYKLPEIQPLVSLIIPTRNGLNLLRQCIDSILTNTNYNNYEIIIVDNGSDDPQALAYFNHLKTQKGFRVIRDDRPFNYSQLNNLAVQQASGEIIGLINNDIEVIDPDWLNEMVSHTLRPEVGAVGAKLLFPNNKLQHGGVILGVGGVANHAHLHMPADHNGYFARMSVTQQFSAVTAACLLVRKAVYEEAGGLDEEHLAVAFNDVDFCIRLTKLGYKNIWTPYALLYHHESATRGQDTSPEKRSRFVSEVNYMMNTWGREFISDPAYNPNLNLDFPDFSLSTQQRLGKWDLDIAALTQSSELHT
jgi:glycosyltransferase involved in cell wall biosynthesis